MKRTSEMGGWATRVGCAALCVLLLALALADSLLRLPETGDKQVAGGKITLDVSHADQGYIMLRYSQSTKRVKARVASGGDTQTYDLRTDGVFEVFPLLNGSGEYAVTVYENVQGSQYATAFSKSVKVKMADPNSAFLYPNQSCMYDADSPAVAKAAELCEGLTDEEKVRAVYAYVSKNVLYNHIKAVTIKKGYLPDVDETFQTGLGICYDYAALVACMLRSQGVPTQIVIGTISSTNQYHAWNRALLDGSWVFLDATFGAQSYPEADYAAERLM